MKQPRTMKTVPLERAREETLVNQIKEHQAMEDLKIDPLQPASELVQIKICRQHHLKFPLKRRGGPNWLYGLVKIAPIACVFLI